MAYGNHRTAWRSLQMHPLAATRYGSARCSSSPRPPAPVSPAVACRSRRLSRCMPSLILIAGRHHLLYSVVSCLRLVIPSL